MALVMYWYDCVCVGIVVVAVAGAILVLIRNEGAGIRSCRLPCGSGEPKYESLLVPAPMAEEEEQGSNNNIMGVGSKGYVSWDSLWRSCWRNVHPGWLLLFRLAAMVIMVCLLIWDIVRWTLEIYVYYTEWTFTLVIIYFGLATLISAKGCSQLSKKDSRRQEDERANFLKVDSEQGTHVEEGTRENFDGGAVKLQSHQQGEENKEKAGFWGYTMQVIFQTSAGAVLLTDSVFWLVIVPFLSTKRFNLNLLMASMHSVNAVLLLIDTALNSMPFPWFRGAYFVLWTAAYVLFQWILHACGFTWWPYPFLELSTPWAPLWYFALALVHIPCYAIFYLLVKLKYGFFPRWFPRAYLSFH